MDYLIKHGFGVREYLIDDEWKKEPRGRVKGIRYQLGDYTEKVKLIAEIWRYIKDRSIRKPKKADKILEQLAKALLTEEELNLFSPWGPRYNKTSPKIKENDPEVATLREIKSALDRFAEVGFIVHFLLMPADSYGVEINNLPVNFVTEYFNWLKEWAYRELERENVKIEVKPWSKIREEHKKRYDELREEISQNFSDWVKSKEYATAVKVARIFNPKNAQQSAMRYCVERVVEGILIYESYDPIKMSLVRKEKDTLDGPLKRIYIIQKRAPWLMGD